MEGLCRLCGSDAIPLDRRPYQKENFAIQIERAFGINVGKDVDYHPKFVCTSCVRSLRRWWDKAKKNKKATLNIKLVDFSSNNQEDTAKPLINWDEIASVAMRHKLCHWEQEGVHMFASVSLSGQASKYIKFNGSDWDAYSNGVQIPKTTQLLKGFNDKVVDTTSILDLVECISKAYICTGNTDLQINHKEKECQLLVATEGRCFPCKIHRSDMMSLAAKRRKAPPVGDILASKTRNDQLPRALLSEKAAKLKNQNKCLKRRSETLQDKIHKLINDESEGVEQRHAQVMAAAIEKEDDDELIQALQNNPAAKLLWSQQKDAFKKNKQMRWHPAMLRWCIALHSKSTSGYELMRSSGFLKLPHPKTLQKYTHFTSPHHGINEGFIDRICSDNDVANMLPHQRNISILMDEMKVKSGLVYNNRSGLLVGFTDIGDLANEMSDFEMRCSGNSEPHLATHILVLMARSICGQLQAPIAYFPTMSIGSSGLYEVVCKAINAMETVGFFVRALVADGASPNRKLFQLLGCSEVNSVGVSFYAANPIDPERRIYFFSDAPHLMKTTRNNWENSGFHNKTKKLHYKKQDIKWTQLLRLSEWDLGMEKRASAGLRRLNKVSYEHLYLTPSHRMKVYLATQVLSASVANAFEAEGRSDTQSTQKFVRFMDRFFDCLNVTRPITNQSKPVKPSLRPYTNVDDWRFKWLEETFLPFFDEWEIEVQNTPNATAAMKKQMCLSPETLTGIRITVHSFVQLGKHLLSSVPGLKYLLSDKFNQDPLEEYFSKQRGIGRSYDNPTVEQFGQNMLRIHVAGSSIHASKKGNCKSTNKHYLDDTPLPHA